MKYRENLTKRFHPSKLFLENHINSSLNVPVTRAIMIFFLWSGQNVFLAELCHENIAIIEVYITNFLAIFPAIETLGN